MANFKAEEVIARIESNKGNVSAVARNFGVSRRTILRFADEHPTVRAALDDARQAMLDNAESVLYSKVLQGSTAELIFFLKTQGRERGYIERSELDVRTKDVSKLSDDELDAIVKT